MHVLGTAARAARPARSTELQGPQASGKRREHCTGRPGGDQLRRSLGDPAPVLQQSFLLLRFVTHPPSVSARLSSIVSLTPGRLGPTEQVGVNRAGSERGAGEDA